MLCENKEFCENAKICPMYKNHQLLGDSQFVRFSQQISHLINYTPNPVDKKTRRIGYCVSGQQILDLSNRLHRKEFDIHSNVIMLIGTNDLVYNTSYSDMCEHFDEIMNILKKSCNKIVLLTIPPVPRLQNRKDHWENLKRFNNFLSIKADGKKVTVVDLCSVFVGFNNTVIEDYYEKVFIKDKRRDLVHLNIKGFKMLKSVLDIQYFDNI